MALSWARRIRRSSSMRLIWVGRRPAVSAMTTSVPRALPALTASKTTAAGSPPCWAMTSTLLRSPQTASCSRAAARNVSPAASRTLLPRWLRYLEILPMEVVLPAPLTPVIMMTRGCACSMSSSRCAGASMRAISSRSARRTSSCVLRPLSLMVSRKRCRIRVDACTPTSAVISAYSSSSRKSSSITPPENRPTILTRVLARPFFNRENHPSEDPVIFL